MRHRTALLLCVLLVGIPLAVAQPRLARAATVTTLLDDFEAATADWFVASGPGTISQVTSPTTSGSGALKLAYDFSAQSQIQVALKRTKADLVGLPRRVSVDVYGDGSWNVVYLQLRDATGEIFHYKLGNLSFTGWRTLTVDPGVSAPTSTLSGDLDGIIDLPLQTYRLVLDKNPGGTKTAGSVVFDRLTEDYEAWTQLRADSPIFVPAAGQTTTVRLGLIDPASFAITLTDEAARQRSFAGSAPGGGVAVTYAWNGRDSAAVLMSGSVGARLTITRAGVTSKFDVPYIAGLPARVEPSAPGSIVGVNSTMTTVATASRSQVEGQGQLMEGAYVRVARESFDWNRLETRKGWYEWAKFDQAVEVSRAHNVQLLGVLEYSAAWASSAPASASDRQYYPPTSVADYAAYARAVVHRYKDRVHTWEVWNEEDSASFWKPAPSASAYAAMLGAAFAAIKAEDPTATVVLGGLVGTDQAFLNGLVAAGAWGNFDVLAIHTFVVPTPESSMMATWLNNARAYVAAKGPKPIWITEFGWSTYSGSGTGYVGVSETTQAQYLARSYLLAASDGVRGVFWYNLVELGTSTTSKLENYGLVETGGRQKPAYAALRRVGELLDQGTTAGTADPNAASRVTADAMESTAGWQAFPLSGGSDTLAVSTTTKHGGAAAVSLTYNFSGSSTGVELVRNLKLAGSPTMVSVWAYGDDSANSVYLKVIDATGESFSGTVGPLLKGWQRLTLYMDGANANWTHSGGDGDGQLDYPLTVRSILVFKAGIGKTSGTVYFDDLQTSTGPRTRGLVVSRRGGLAQSLYVVSGSATQAVSVTGSQAWLVDGPTLTALTVSSGKVSVTEGALPVNVLCNPGLDPSTISPNGDGVNDSAYLRWVSGDRTKYTFAVLAASTDTVLRTVTSGAWTDAGPRSAKWDGLLGGLPAGPGTYRLRLTVIGPDGRVSYLVKTVQVV